jgi:iron complex outermembrane receptor protein
VIDIVSGAARSLKLGRACAASVLALLSVQQAFAQEAAPADTAEAETTDIVVTANRRAERLQDVPMAVNVLSAETLESAAITDSQYLATLVPGLSVTQINSSQYYLRGVGFAGTAVNSEQSVASYIDGVFVYTTIGSLSLASLDRVEVLRGPQGTLFGRNTTGGVIQAVTRDPLADPSFEASLGYATYRTWTGSFYGNAHLAKNLGLSLAADFRQQGDGFGVNLTTGKDTWVRNDANFRVKLAYEPSEDTRITGFFQYRAQDGSGINYVPIPGARGVDGVEAAAYGRFDTRGEGYNKFQTESYLGYVRVEQGLGEFATLTSITSYHDVQPFPYFDSDATPVRVLAASQDLFFHNFSQEIQLASKGDGPLDWIVGAYYYKAWAGMDPMVLRGAAGGATGETRFVRRQRTKSLAGFGQLTFELTDSTKFTAGLRYTDETQSLPNDLYTLIGPDPTPTRLPFPSVPAAPLDSSGWTWRLALDHKFSDDIMAYVSWNRGLKGGGFTLTTAADTPPYAPEKLDAYEAGLKMEFANGKVRINPAIFLYKFKDIQVNSFNGFLTLLTNAAAATIKGVDVDAAIQLSRRLQLTAAFEYLDSRFDRFPNAVAFMPNPAPAGGATQQNNFNATGNRLPYAPETSGSLGAAYKAPLGNGELTLDGSVRYVGKQFAGPSNRFAIPAYTLASIGAGWATSDERFGVRIWADNLFDKDYWFQVFESSLGIMRNAGAPRTYGITLSTKM